MTDTTPTTRTAECHECKIQFETDEEFFRWDTCPECMERYAEKCREEKSEKLEAEMQQRIHDLLPPRFRLTDTAHSAFNGKLWHQVKEWHPTPENPFLGLVGTTGRCKTRCAYLRLVEVIKTPVQKWRDHPEDLSVEESIKNITASEFVHAVRNQFSQNGEEAKECRRLLDAIHSRKWLLFDDLGKFTNTPAIVAALFGVIDHRHSYNLPTIWTSNLDPTEFLASAPADIGAPLAGRLIECSTIFTV
jgi:hypothetical protein